MSAPSTVSAPRPIQLMTASVSKLPTHEVMFLRRIKKTAVILLLLYRLNRSITAKEVSQILEINYETARIYLKELSCADLVERTGQGFKISDFGSNLLMNAPPYPGFQNLGNAEFPRSTLNNSSSNNGDDLNFDTTNVSNSMRGHHSEYPETWKTLTLYGITRNPRTEKLASQPFMTPEYIQHHAKSLEETGKHLPQWAGLLITILERGD